MSGTPTERALVVVTGGGSGMGRDVALDQAALGRDVIVVGRRPEPLAETRGLAFTGAGAISSVVADASTPEGIELLVAAIGERQVLGIVAAAGGNTGLRASTPPETVDLVRVDGALTTALRTNLFSAVLPIEAILPRVISGEGRIVLIGSTAGLSGSAGDYGTAKAALAGYGHDLARRAGVRGIAVNTLAPGFVAETGFFAAAGMDDISPLLGLAADRTLVGRVGKPRDITAAVRYLLDVDAGWMTGQTLSVNGGTDLLR